MSAVHSMKPYQRRWLYVFISVYGAVTLALVLCLAA